MANLKMLTHRLVVTIVYGTIGAMAIGFAYTAGDAAYALGGFVGAG